MPGTETCKYDFEWGLVQFQLLVHALDAADIAQTNSMKLDSDVKNLVILIPDKRLITQEFLPLDATIVEGTKVIWSNADKMNPHGISLVQDSDNQVLLSNDTIPISEWNRIHF